MMIGDSPHLSTHPLRHNGTPMIDDCRLMIDESPPPLTDSIQHSISNCRRRVFYNFMDVHSVSTVVLSC
jgi:hypothetical protein